MFDWRLYELPPWWTTFKSADMWKTSPSNGMFTVSEGSCSSLCIYHWTVANNTHLLIVTILPCASTHMHIFIVQHVGCHVNKCISWLKLCTWKLKLVYNGIRAALHLYSKFAILLRWRNTLFLSTTTKHTSHAVHLPPTYIQHPSGVWHKWFLNQIIDQQDLYLSFDLVSKSNLDRSVCVN